MDNLFEKPKIGERWKNQKWPKKRRMWANFDEKTKMSEFRWKITNEWISVKSWGANFDEKTKIGEFLWKTKNERISKKSCNMSKLRTKSKMSEFRWKAENEWISWKAEISLTRKLTKSPQNHKNVQFKFEMLSIGKFPKITLKNVQFTQAAENRLFYFKKLHKRKSQISYSKAVLISSVLCFFNRNLIFVRLLFDLHSMQLTFILVATQHSFTIKSLVWYHHVWMYGITITMDTWSSSNSLWLCECFGSTKTVCRVVCDISARMNASSIVSL